MPPPHGRISRVTASRARRPRRSPAPIASSFTIRTATGSRSFSGCGRTATKRTTRSKDSRRHTDLWFTFRARWFLASAKRQHRQDHTMDKRKILIQLDSDPQPSVFDRVVAIDAGADEAFSYGGVKPEHVRDMVHGAIFTRGPKDLKSTAFFIGGADVAKGEQLLAEVCKHMLPQYGLRVSVLLDANGANTTAAAAVRAASRHL